MTYFASFKFKGRSWGDSLADQVLVTVTQGPEFDLQNPYRNNSGAGKIETAGSLGFTG